MVVTVSHAEPLIPDVAKMGERSAAELQATTSGHFELLLGLGNLKKS